MVTKSKCKEEARKLRKLEEHTEEWVSKAAGSLKLTRELCLRAVGAACHESHHMNELDMLLDEATEAMLGSLMYASKFASSKRSEVMNEYQKRGKQAKGSPRIQQEMQKKVEHAFADVGMTIFEALQSQARELDRIATKSMQVIGRSSLRMTASKSEQILPSLECRGLSSSQELWIADSPAKCQTSGSVQDCSLDWDGFESDLKVMSTTVNSCVHDVALSTSATDMIAADSMVMLTQLKEAEEEKDEALKRAHQAENSLHELERVHHSSLEKFSTFYTEDDIVELQRALKLEQMARVGLEVKLREAKSQARAAQDDSKAAQFALTVAQQVAAKMASSSHRRNPSTDSLGKSPSEELPPLPVEADSRITLRPSVSMGSIPQVPQRIVEVPADLETDGAKRSDSAFIVRSASLENTVSPTSTTTAQVNEGEGESSDDNTSAAGSPPSNAALEILTTRGTRETFGEEPRESFATESLDSFGGVPTEPFLPAPKTIEIGSRSSGSIEDRADSEQQMGLKDGWCENSPPKPNGWNPFECQGEKTHSQSISDDDESVQKVQSHNAFVSMEAIPDTREGGAAEKEAWNPFVDDRIEISKPASKQEEGEDSWNPFSSGGKESIQNLPAGGEMVGEKSPEENKQSEAWNPFSVASAEPMKKCPQGEWNPFSTDSDCNVTGENKDAVWNPFV